MTDRSAALRLRINPRLVISLLHYARLSTLCLLWFHDIQQHA